MEIYSCPDPIGQCRIPLGWTLWHDQRSRVVGGHVHSLRVSHRHAPIQLPYLRLTPIPPRSARNVRAAVALLQRRMSHAYAGLSKRATCVATTAALPNGAGRQAYGFRT